MLHLSSKHWLGMLLGLCTLCLPLRVLAQNLPDFAQVVSHLKERYSGPNEAGSYYSLAKKPDGWHLLRYDFYAKETSYKLSKEWPLWLTSTGAFATLPLDARSESSRSALNLSRADAFNADRYNRMPFYGYKGWHDDVIRVHGSTVGPRDTILEALARAHGHYASGIVYPRSEDAPSYDFALRGADGKLTVDALKAYLQAVNNALYYWEELARRFPSYETYVGLSGLKFSNECVNVWMELVMNGQDELAGPFLRKANYDPHTLEIIGAVLNAAPPDAILLANGDNDTFPFWFLQYARNQRTDVRVLNLSLMNTDKFYAWMQKQVGLSAPLPLSKPQSHYANGAHQLAYPKDLPDSLILPIGSAAWAGIAASDISVTRPVSWLLYPKKPAMSYYEMNDLVMLDLLETNARKGWARPVCVQHTVSGNSFPYIQPFLYNAGAYKRLLPLASTVSNPVLESAFQGFFRQLSLPVIQSQKLKDNVVAMSYFSLGNQLLLRASSKGIQADVAKSLLTRLTILFPPDRLNYEPNTALIVAKTWFELEDKAQAQKWAEYAVHRLETKVVPALALDTQRFKQVADDWQQLNIYVKYTLKDESLGQKLSQLQTEIKKYAPLRK